AQLVLGRGDAADLGVLEEPEQRPVPAILLGREVALLGRDGEERAGAAGPRERRPRPVGAHPVGVVLAVDGEEDLARRRGAALALGRVRLHLEVEPERAAAEDALADGA